MLWLDLLLRNLLKLMRIIEMKTLGWEKPILGINFHKKTSFPAPKETELSKQVLEFAILNSTPVPDSKANPSNPDQPSKRYALHYQSVLHEAFLVENADKICSYSMFCKLRPSFVVKPNLENRGSKETEGGLCGWRLVPGSEIGKRRKEQ